MASPYCIPLQLEWGHENIVYMNYSKIVSPDLYPEARCSTK
jgi:hypothetical protein